MTVTSWIAVTVVAAAIILIVCSLCAISGDCSREEEIRDIYSDTKKTPMSTVIDKGADEINQIHNNKF